MVLIFCVLSRLLCVCHVGVGGGGVGCPVDLPGAYLVPVAVLPEEALQNAREGELAHAGVSRSVAHRRPGKKEIDKFGLDLLKMWKAAAIAAVRFMKQ